MPMQNFYVAWAVKRILWYNLPRIERYQLVVTLHIQLHRLPILNSISVIFHAFDCVSNIPRWFEL